MAPPLLRLIESPTQRPEDAFFDRSKEGEIGRALRDMGLITSTELVQARRDALRLGLELGQFLVRNRVLSQSAVLRARSHATGARIIDLAHIRPDTRLIDMLGAARCIQLSVAPLRRIGGAILVATPDPTALEGLDIDGSPLIPLLATQADIRDLVVRVRGSQLSRRAETRTDIDFSIRPESRRRPVKLLALLAAGAFCLFAFPQLALPLLLIWSAITMIALIALKVTSAMLLLVFGQPKLNFSPIPLSRRPEVSLLVPLFREKDIANRLISRLNRLEYPIELLDICLIIEAGDSETARALDASQLPPQFQVVTVPEGTIKTKPRALNYALDHCRGQIVGVYDAEDAPEPDQLNRVVDRFASAPPELACLQGRLDFYNSKASWLARCFAIEYAVWFRVILPGLQRIGWPVPLGGTTVFFRREALENVGAWDSHNVTEDADLGMRLARMGYRTELVDTVTYEEATSRPWAWIRQRSRWLKGYAMTYAVHMRSPQRLAKDLGRWGFIGFQILFLGTLSQFVLAPILWTLWPIAFGYSFEFTAQLHIGLLVSLASVFVISEIAAYLVALVAVRGKSHRHLVRWIITMPAYFPMASLAMAKALWELKRNPFYWDKTQHGQSDRTHV